MPAEPDLAPFRAEIDRIDDRILDLLVERFAVVARIAAAKAGQRASLALRPAREAAILRRLVARADGRIPTGTLVRTWRELLAASTRLQTPLALAVWAPAGRERVWDLARDQFGSATPAERATDPRRALRRVASGEAQIAVLPLPEEGEDWWTDLLEPPGDALCAIGRLPFVAEGGCEALAFAALDPEPSGDDRSLFVLETEGAISRAGLLLALEQARLFPRPLASLARDGRTRHLVELSGWFARGEQRLEARVPALRGQLLRALAIGAYPSPLSGEGAGAGAQMPPFALASE
ncbi:MAG: chorismate mutase [Geminicoccaceae bacterium]|nr:chorismate mutase [Geminicoccaceae bacterium]